MEELLENQKLLQSIFDNTTNAISIKKINGDYIIINRSIGYLTLQGNPSLSLKIIEH